MLETVARLDLHSSILLAWVSSWRADSSDTWLTIGVELLLAVGTLAELAVNWIIAKSWTAGSSHVIGLK